MAKFSVLFDACVLVPITLADTLLRLAESGFYRPLWSRCILEEMVRALTDIHPELGIDKAQHRADVMDSAFEDACVTAWEPLVPHIDLPDPDDRHVVAAALHGRADLIVTANLRDFPPQSLPPEIEVVSPDAFLLDQLDLNPDSVVQVLHQQAAATRRPSISYDTLVVQLSRCGVPTFSKTVARQKWRRANE